MAWWDSSGLSSFATQALKTAQKRIDKVLDIDVDEGDNGATPSTSQDSELPTASETSESGPANEMPASGAESDGFWNAWLSPTSTSSSELSTSLSHPTVKKKESKSKDRSQLKGKLGLGKKLRPSLSVEIPSPQYQTSVEAETSRAVPQSSVTEDSYTKVVEKLPAESKIDDFEENKKELEDEEELSRHKMDDRRCDDMKHDSDLNTAALQSRDDSSTGIEHTKVEHSIEEQESVTSFESGQAHGSADTILPRSASSDRSQTKEQTKSRDHENEGFTTVQTPEGCFEQSAVGEATEALMQKSSEQPTDDETAPIEGSFVLSTSSGWSEASLVAMSDQQSGEDFDSCKELDTKCTADSQTVAVAASQELLVGCADEETGSGLSSMECEAAENWGKREVMEEKGRMKVSVAPVHSTPMGDETEDQEEGLAKSGSQGQLEASDESVTTVDDGSSLSEGNRTLTSDDFTASGFMSAEEHGGNDDSEREKGEEMSDPETASGQNLSSSCYVKDLLEEAMVESVKDTDSKASSTSSCNMARIESSQNSGQTSADEIDTTTSSDIEIISHISTPTPNGDNNGQTPFDLSPLRHALSRGFPRGSSSGHARSDSSSSSTSKNGDEASPEATQGHKQGRGTRMGAKAVDVAAVRSTAADSECQEQMSQSEEMEKLFKAPEPNMPLQPIPETADSADIEVGEGRFKPPAVVDSETIDPSYLLERLASMAEVLDAREKKLVELSKENMDLQETQSILRTQLQQSEEARESEMADLNQVTDEFTERLSDAESRLQKVIREKDTFKKKLHDAETEFAKSRSSEKLLKEKDQQISELLMEGEKLSKQQLQNSTIIKKLRSKDKENDSLIKSQKQKTDEQKAEIEHLHGVLDSKIELEKKQTDAIKQLNDAVVKQEQEISRLKEELEDSQEKIRSMQVTLDHSYKELAELQKMDVARQSRTHEEVLSAEMQAKEETRLALERAQLDARQQHDALVMQIDDLRLSLTRQEREHARREEMLKQEIADLQQRLQEADDRNQELTQNVSAATRPLLRQIENLQATHAAQIASYERVERSLADRLNEAQVQLAFATEKERATTEQMMEVTTRISTLESQVATLRQEKCRLQAALEMEQTKADLLQETKINDTTKLEMAKQTLSKENRELKKESMLLENQLEVEKMKTESEKKKVVLAHEMLRDKEMQLARMSSWSPASRRGSVHSESSMSQDEMLERTLMATVGTNGNKMSLYDSLRQSGATTLLENLQSQLKQRNGEITQLQSEITELEKTRESMAKELVNLTTKNDQLEENLDTLVTLQQQYKALDKRYNALLQMYGEKVEQTQELSLDLQDMKELYKSQIDELLKTPDTRDM